MICLRLMFAVDGLLFPRLVFVLLLGLLLIVWIFVGLLGYVRLFAFVCMVTVLVY